VSLPVWQLIVWLRGGGLYDKAVLEGLVGGHLLINPKVHVLFMEF